MMTQLWQYIQIAFRSLLKRPVFAIASILILGLGIGATVSMFTVIHSLLYKQLPFGHADQLTILFSRHSIPGGGLDDYGVSAVDYLDWRERNHSFSAMGAMQPDEAGLTNTGKPEQLNVGRISISLFPALEASPVIGRTFSADEENGANVAIISYSIWRDRFGGTPELLKKSIELDNVSHRIVGVMPRDFYFASDIDVWTPLDLTTARNPRQTRHNLYVTGRLKSSVPLQQASNEMTAIVTQLGKEYPDTNKNWGIRIVPIRDQMVGTIRPMLKILMAAVLFLLLITCANVANLALTRSVEREPESALRTVLGASRFQLLREPLTESVLLALCGGLFGFLISAWCLKPLIAMSPIVASSPDGAKIFQNVSINLTVLGFTFCIAIFTALMFGILPNLRITPKELASSLKDTTRRNTAGVRGRRAQRVLVLVELAVAFVLLIGAGVLLKSFSILRKSDIGFNPKNVLTLKINMPDTRYENHAKRAAFLRQAVEKLSVLPGSISASATTRLPLNEFSFTTDFEVEGHPVSSSAEFPSANFRRLVANYFRTIGVSVLEGRDFSTSDTEESEPVAIVSREMERHYWPGQSALGKRIRRQGATDHVWRTIVGVVSDVKDFSASAGPSSTLYLPFSQNSISSVFIVVKTSIAPESMVKPVQTALWELDKDLAISDIKSMETVFSESLSAPRFAASLIAIFAIIGLILAAIGTYAVIAYHSAQRTNEIGIRMAIGASQYNVLWLVVKQALALSIAGVTVGLVFSKALSQFIAGFVFGVSPTDAGTYAVVTFVLLMISVLASYFPARKASRIHPRIALNS